MRAVGKSTAQNRAVMESISKLEGMGMFRGMKLADDAICEVCGKLLAQRGDNTVDILPRL